MYVAPTVGGRWYYCQSCGFRGDSIELYCEAHKLPDIRDAVFELLGKRILPLTREQTPLETVNKYVISYVQERKRFTDLFRTAQEGLAELDTTALALLDHHHLWLGYNAGHWHKHISKFVGLLHPETVRAYGFKMSRKSAFGRVLVCPFYDIPGRICAVKFYGFRGAVQTERAKFIAVTDDGLMMLDSLQLHNDSVIAMDDPIFALQLQRKQFNITNKPLNMVVYGSETSRAWQSVSARRVVFWDQEPEDYWTFKQALQHPRAYVTHHPQFIDQAEFVSKKSLSLILDTLHNGAKPWAEAMKRVILEGEHWKISDFVINMKLSAPDLQRIYDTCTPAEKQHVRRALGEVPFDRFVNVAGMRISESDDGWWIVNQDNRELGCSVIIRLDSAIHVPDSDENYYEGTIISRGKQIQFRERMDTIEKQTAIWLRNLMMRNGLGPPTVQRKVKAHLIEIAKQFQEPQYVQRSGRVGWNAELQGFVFPNFTIRYGSIDESNRALVYDKNVPAANVMPVPPSSGEWDLMLDDTAEAAALWAGLSCFMTNMIAPILSAPQLAVGFVGGSGSVARVVGKHLASELGMIQLQIQKPNSMIDYRLPKEQAHGYPVWIDLSVMKRPVTSHFEANSSGNFMLDMSEGEATALGVGDQWAFVNAPVVANQSRKLPSLRGVMRYLVWLQSQSFVLQPASSLHESVLQSLNEWATADLNAVDHNVFKRAESMLWGPGRFNIDRRMLHLVFWLVSNGRLKLAMEPFYATFSGGSMPTKKGVLVDQAAGKVFINLLELGNVIRTSKLPSPDLDEAVRHALTDKQTTGFELGNDCFVVSHKYWSDELTRWRQLRL